MSDVRYGALFVSRWGKWTLPMKSISKTRKKGIRIRNSFFLLFPGCVIPYSILKCKLIWYSQTATLDKLKQKVFTRPKHDNLSFIRFLFWIFQFNESDSCKVWKNIYKNYTFERKTDFFHKTLLEWLKWMNERDGKRHKTKYDSNDLTGQKHNNLFLY